MNYPTLLNENLALIRRLIFHVARAQGLVENEWDDFAGYVFLKLVENDFRRLRHFQGRSKLSTYLTAVIHRLCIDYIVSIRGKWRPTVAALGLGGTAGLLERLLVRDGLSLEEAISTLRINYGLEVRPSQLFAVALEILARSRSGRGTLEGGATPPVELRDPVKLRRLFNDAVKALPPEDRQLLQLRVSKQLTLEQIAAQHGVSLSVVSRRLRAKFRALRSELVARGLEWDDVEFLLETEHISLAGILSD